MRQLQDILPLQRPLVGLDLETTGVNKKTARICAVAIEVMTPEQPAKEHYTLVNPLEPIPPSATAIHSISDAMVKDAPTFAQFAKALAGKLRDCDYAGYNVSFDLEILAEEFKRAGETWNYEGAKIIDGYRLWQLTSPRTLVDYAAANGIPLADAHDALADVKASTRAIAAHLVKCATLPRSVAELHKLCNPNAFDAEGKLKWQDGELCLTFGEHRGQSLRQVPQGYLRWILGKDFSALVKKTCEDALRGVYPNE